jgi:hypothetical protein
MQTRLKRLAIIFCLVALVAAAGWTLLQYLAVPYRCWEPAAFSPIWQRDGYPEIPADAKILRLAARAKRDFFMAPIPGLPHRPIIFGGVRAHGREVYLLFTPDVSDTVVVYCGTPEDGRLHWKMVLGIDA